MQSGKREPRPRVARRESFRPVGEGLEGRLLMAIDVGGTAASALPNVATVPYGVLSTGTVPAGGVGFSEAIAGDINADGYSDVLIGAPGAVAPGPILGPIGPGSSAAPPAAYLVFGSKQAGAGNVDWATLDKTGQRVGDLSQLGAATQTNPITTTGTNFAYDGFKFIASKQGAGSLLGASVSSAGIINGSPAFLIGAPGALDYLGNNPGTGRAYLVYGTGLNPTTLTNKTIDLDAPPTGVNVITFVNTSLGNSLLGSETGYSVSTVFNFLGDGGYDVVIGAPNASVGGLTNYGAVYVIPATALPSTTTTVNLALVGQAGGINGLVIAGPASGSNFGWSVADAGNVNGLLNGTTNIDSLIIGAPNANNNTGAAYLLDGGINYSTVVQTSLGTTFISANQIGNTFKDGTQFNVPGAEFLGVSPGDNTGWSVGSAGFLDYTGFTDIIIGSPGATGNTGTATVVYSSPFGAPSGVYQLQTPSSTVPLPVEINNASVLEAATYYGTTAGDLVGYSVSLVGQQSGSLTNEIAIGAPGVNTNTGSVYIIPGTSAVYPGTGTLGYANLVGSFGLRSAQSQPVGATQLIETTPGGSTVVPTFLGASVASQLIALGQTHSIDANPVGPILVGAPGFTPSTSLNYPGASFNLEGSLVPKQKSIGNVLLSGGTSIIASNTTTGLVTIRVLSNTSTIPNFLPASDIDPTRIIINGFLVPAGDVSNFTTTPDVNGDIIPDVTFQVPITDLHLTTGQTATVGSLVNIGGFTIQGSTNNSSNFWIGGFANNGTGSGNGTGGTGTGTGTGIGGIGVGGSFGTGLPLGVITPTQYIPPFGPDVYVPSLTTLSQYDQYKPIPYRVAIHQYLPKPGFASRMLIYFYPHAANNKPHRDLGSTSYHNPIHVHARQGAGKIQIPHHVFTQSKYKPHHHLIFTHPMRVVPVNEQTQRF